MNENDSPCIKTSSEKAKMSKTKEYSTMGIYKLYRSLSPLAVWIKRKGVSMPLRNIRLYVGQAQLLALFLAFTCGKAYGATYTVNVYLPTAALQADFLANATSYFKGTVSKGIFTNTSNLTVTGKNLAPPCGGIAPCDLDKDIALMVANSTNTYCYGFANGMDSERYQTVNLLYDMQGKDFAKKTCAGDPVVATSTTACQNACIHAYNVIVSTINQRWGMVFTSTGGFVQ